MHGRGRTIYGSVHGYACHLPSLSRHVHSGRRLVHAGSIHPRVKRLVGTRLAKAARGLAYNDNEVVWTGPVLTGCSTVPGGIKLSFDREKLKTDTIMVLESTANAISLLDSQGSAWAVSMLRVLQQLGAQSPLEIQFGGGPNPMQNGTDGIWVAATLQPKCAPRGQDGVDPGQGGCNWDPATGSKTDGWDEVFVPVPAELLSNVTGIRYAWGENPCCPSFNRNVVPCPPASCPIQTFNSTMPAVPFWASISRGQCNWISTSDS